MCVIITLNLHISLKFKALYISYLQNRAINKHYYGKTIGKVAVQAIIYT